MHHSGYILYDRYVCVKSRYIQTQTLRGHAWKVHRHKHTHDTRYMQNYSKLGLEQPGAGGSGSTYDEARTKGATQARVPRRRAARARVNSTIHVS